MADILDFEEELMLSQLSDEDKKLLSDSNSKLTREEFDRAMLQLEDQQLLEDKLYLPDTGTLIKPTSPKNRKELIDQRSAMHAREFLESMFVRPYRDGKERRVEMYIDPIIFVKRGKTPPSVPYLKVKITTSLSSNHEILHHLHTKVRLQNQT